MTLGHFLTFLLGKGQKITPGQKMTNGQKIPEKMTKGHFLTPGQKSVKILTPYLRMIIFPGQAENDYYSWPT